MATERNNTNVVLSVLGFILKAFLNILFYVMVIYGVYTLSTDAYDFAYQIFGDETAYVDGDVITIQIPINQGQSTMSVASNLEAYNVIKSRFAFYIKVKLMSYHIMPGTYIVSSDMTYDQILEIICGG